MSRTQRRRHRARKRFRCDGRWGSCPRRGDGADECSGFIEPGEVYERLSLPPGAEPNDGDHWWTMRQHAGGA